VIVVVIPLLLGASDDLLGNAAAIGAGALLSNGYACALLHLSARKWEQTHNRLILYEVRPHWSIRPTVVYLTAVASGPASPNAQVVAPQRLTS